MGKVNKLYSLLHEEKSLRSITNKQKSLPISSQITNCALSLQNRYLNYISPGCGEGIAAQFKGSLKEMTICLIISTKSIYLKTVFLQNVDNSNYVSFLS